MACFRRWKEQTLAVRAVHQRSREVLVRMMVKLKARPRLIPLVTVDSCAYLQCEGNEQRQVLE